MIIFLYLIIGLALAAGGVRIGFEIHGRREYKALYGYAPKELDGISWAGMELIKEYHSIPETNRPYANIKAIVSALDTKYTVKKVNAHFRKQQYSATHRGNVFVRSWEHSCYGVCDMYEYKDMYKSFMDIRQALVDQAYRLAVAGVSDALNEAEELTKRLREEKELINQVTKELV